MFDADNRANDAVSTLAGWQEREKRAVTTLLVGRVVQDDGMDDLCRVRNMSSGGMMLETQRGLKVGHAIELILRHHELLRGRVVWAKGNRAGVQFDAPIDVERLLAVPLNRPARPGGPMPRAPRFETRCPSELRIDRATVVPVIVTDISQSGARVELPKPLQLEDGVVLSIPDLSPRRCTVRWVRDDAAGLGFFTLLTFAEFSDWLANGRCRFSAG